MRLPGLLHAELLFSNHHVTVYHKVTKVKQESCTAPFCKHDDDTYCVAETITGSAVLLQPFISILPSGRAVPVIMPVVLNGVATLP